MKRLHYWDSHAAVARTHDAFLLSVLTKRTYAWDFSGITIPAPEQRPLTHRIEHERRARNGDCAVLARGRDAWPLKSATDVIVTGFAHTPGGKPATQMPVSVGIGMQTRHIRVFGPRHVNCRGRGSLTFSSPEPFTDVELSWWNAYGGVDPKVLPDGLDDTPVFCGKPMWELFPGAYPRNPCGVGYVVHETPELLDGMPLPQLENPRQLLTPETLLVRDPTQWWRCPMPACFAWAHALWFPRIVHAGGKPYYLPPSGDGRQSLRELELGRISAAQLTETGSRFANARLSNEAAPEMVFPFLQGDEIIRLDGFDPRGEMRFSLPREVPTVAVRADGVQLSPIGAVIHTLVVDAEKREFCIVWSTRFPLELELAIDIAVGLPVEEVVERCEITVDGVRLGPDQWPESPTDLAPPSDLQALA